MVRECSFAGGTSGGVSASTGSIPFSGCITSMLPKPDLPLPVFPTAAHTGPQRIVGVPHRDSGGEVLHITYRGQGKTLCGKACHPDDILRTPVQQWRTWPAMWCDKCAEYSQE